MGRKAEERQPKFDLSEAADIIGADAADQTSGTPETPEEWIEEQPLVDEPTRPLDAGEPSPFEPGAATPAAEESPEPERGDEKHDQG